MIFISHTMKMTSASVALVNIAEYLVGL